MALSNCTCLMSFAYDVRTLHPLIELPVHLVQKFGADPRRHGRDQKTLWSAKAATRRWTGVRVGVKLVADGTPFVLEFNEIGASKEFRSSIFLDRILFHGCGTSRGCYEIFFLCFS